jgi:hypothetical protein
MVPVTVKVGRRMGRRTDPFDMSTVCVDNFVDNGILIHGNHGSQTCNHRKPGKNSQLFLFKINDLENAS